MSTMGNISLLRWIDVSPCYNLYRYIQLSVQFFPALSRVLLDVVPLPDSNPARRLDDISAMHSFSMCSYSSLPAFVVFVPVSSLTLTEPIR